MKKLTTLLLVFVLALSVMPIQALASVVSPTQTQISAVSSVYVNDVLLEADPSMGFFFLDSNGRTMAPLRLLVESLGYEVLWDNDFQKITVPNGPAGDVVMWVGKTVYTVGIETKTMDTMPVIIKDLGRTVVPLRFLSEALNCSIETKGWGTNTGGQIWITAPMGVKSPTEDKPAATGIGSKTMYDLMDNTVIAELMNDSFASKSDSGVIGYIQSVELAVKMGIEIEGDTLNVALYQGLQDSPNDPSYSLLETALTAAISKEEAAKIVAVLKEYNAATIEVSKKYAEYFLNGDITSWWMGDDTTRAKKNSEIMAVHRQYKVSISQNDEAYVWQTIGNTSVAFDISAGFHVIVK